MSGKRKTNASRPAPGVKGGEDGRRDEDGEEDGLECRDERDVFPVKSG